MIRMISVGRVEDARMERLIEERLIVASELIFSVGYSARRSDLEVQFQDGRLMRYLAVPASVYLD